LDSRYQRLPKTDFFKSLYSKDEDLQAFLKRLHKLFATDYNNVDIRAGRKRVMAQVFEWVFERAMRLQLQPAGWSTAQGFELPLAQQLWLDAAFLEQRDEHINWQDDIAEAVLAWFIPTYNRSQTEAITLGTVEVHALQNEFSDYFRAQKEFIQ
jgi:CRISPR-associated protein Csy1